MGRPKKNGEEKRDEYLKVRLTSDEKYHLDILIEHEKVNGSEYLRSLIESAYAKYAREKMDKAAALFDDSLDF